MNTGGRIRQARVARGFSMRALASRVGVSPAAIAKYEHGESIPRPSVLLRLAREIGVDTCAREREGDRADAFQQRRWNPALTCPIN